MHVYGLVGPSNKADITKQSNSMLNKSSSSSDSNNNHKHLKSASEHTHLNTASHELTFNILTAGLILFLTAFSFQRVVILTELSNKQQSHISNYSFAYAYLFFVVSLLLNLLFMARTFAGYSKSYKDKFARRHLASCRAMLARALCIVGIKVIFHMVLESYVPLRASPIFVSYADMTLVNIYLNQLRDKRISAKSEGDLNRCIGFNYAAWVAFTVLVSVLQRNFPFLTASQLYWHGLTLAFFLAKIWMYNRVNESKFNLSKQLFSLVKSNDYYFLFMPIRMYGLFRIVVWFDLS